MVPSDATSSENTHRSSLLCFQMLQALKTLQEQLTVLSDATSSETLTGAAHCAFRCYKL